MTNNAGLFAGRSRVAWRRTACIGLYTLHSALRAQKNHHRKTNEEQ